jgi:hypothetical protein
MCGAVIRKCLGNAVAVRIEAGGLNRQRLAPLCNRVPSKKKNLPFFQLYETSPITMSGAELALGIVGAVAAVDVAIR